MKFQNCILIILNRHTGGLTHGQAKAICPFNFSKVGGIKDLFIATNQRVVAAQRQQRGLVAVTIRGSFLFYSSAI